VQAGLAKLIGLAGETNVQASVSQTNLWLISYFSSYIAFNLNIKMSVFITAGKKNMVGTFLS
jgi:hypothetical protein